MKPIFLFPLLAILCACSGTSSTKNDLARYGYQGEVKRLITFKYLNYSDSLPLDSGAFNYRTVYDYTEDGHVNFMQFVFNRSRENQRSMAINYTYTIKGGSKTGWHEINLMYEDTSYGTIEFLDHTHIYERKYARPNQLAYEIITEIDSLSFEERVAEVKHYQDMQLTANQKILNMVAITGENMRIEEDVLTGNRDTIFVEILKKDEVGNATDLLETRASNLSKTLIHKTFTYY